MDIESPLRSHIIWRWLLDQKCLQQGATKRREDAVSLSLEHTIKGKSNKLAHSIIIYQTVNYLNAIRSDDTLFKNHLSITRRFLHPDDYKSSKLCGWHSNQWYQADLIAFLMAAMRTFYSANYLWFYRRIWWIIKLHHQLEHYLHTICFDRKIFEISWCLRFSVDWWCSNKLIRLPKSVIKVQSD